ncbi:hypothetical protein Hdeb2414_s0014g00433121 [Helianthus debilis subsp. tardiflorus]
MKGCEMYNEHKDKRKKKHLTSPFLNKVLHSSSRQTLLCSAGSLESLRTIFLAISCRSLCIISFVPITLGYQIITRHLLMRVTIPDSA